MTARTKSWWRAAASMRSCSACKPPATADQLGFRAGLGGEVTRPDLDAGLLEKLAGRRAAGEDPDVVVRNLFCRSCDVEPDRLGENLDRLRIEDHLRLPTLGAFRDALRIPLLCAA